jgi:hypothetical protein
MDTGVKKVTNYFRFGSIAAGVTRLKQKKRNAESGKAETF